MILFRQILAACLVAGLGSAAHAQAPTPVVAATPTPSATDNAALQKAVDQRIEALRAKLAITAAQSAQWTSFATAMRDNAASTNQLFEQRAQNAATMSAVENMKSYAAIARAYADNTQHLATAFETLYGGLSPDQQKTADELFRAPPAPAPKHR